jgi:hypothetical protein
MSHAVLRARKDQVTARPDLPGSRRNARKHAATRNGLSKTATGIAGFDEKTMGGLPKGRAKLICGGAGC